MILSIGLDLINSDRIWKLYVRYGDRLIGRLLGQYELRLWRLSTNPGEFLSGRFAAKEAIIKGLGAYLQRRPPMRELQLLEEENGQLMVRFPMEVARQMDRCRCHVSVSHNHQYALAVAMFEEES
jgi:holo-[acyl-carrier protein] synthase